MFAIAELLWPLAILGNTKKYTGTGQKPAHHCMQAVMRLLSNAPMYGAIAANGMSKMLLKYYLPKKTCAKRQGGENKPTALNKLLSIPLKASNWNTQILNLLPDLNCLWLWKR